MRADLNAALVALDAVLLDKPGAVRLSLACLLAGGHLLIEDVPGMGKTLLAQALARVLGLEYKRVQCSSDLLPGDITGAPVYRQASGEFEFRPGPVFTQVLLVDEINRASPKTQSALLEAMEERQVSADGRSYPLPQPFFVVATQNPQDDLGTFALPEAQLDRFLMRLSLGYPGRASEYAILRGQGRQSMLQNSAPALDAANVLALQAEAAGVAVADALLDYVYALTQATRDGRFRRGLSVRAAQAVVGAARAWAYIDGRAFVIPADVQAVFAAVADHRLESAVAGQGAAAVATHGAALLAAVPVPV
ncbi:MAG TPA: AAA family ATPase [Burkholderiaceae bacterium]